MWEGGETRISTGVARFLAATVYGRAATRHNLQTPAYARMSGIECRPIYISSGSLKVSRMIECSSIGSCTTVALGVAAGEMAKVQ